MFRKREKEERERVEESAGLIHHPVHIVIRSIVKGIHHMHTHAYSIPKSQHRTNEMDVAIFILACMALAITLTLAPSLSLTHRSPPTTQKKKLAVFATCFFFATFLFKWREIFVDYLFLFLFVNVTRVHSCYNNYTILFFSSVVIFIVFRNKY